jgi:preprotein translocase subunit YajC
MTMLNVFAQAAADGASKPNPWMPFIMMGLFFLAMWFLLIAPQRKRQKEHQKMMDALKVGDVIVTNGGLYGTIQQVRSDRYVIKIDDNTRIELAKGFIASKADENADKK